MKMLVSLTINPEALEFLEALSLEDFYAENKNHCIWTDAEFERLFMSLLQRHKINLVKLCSIVEE